MDEGTKCENRKISDVFQLVNDSPETEEISSEELVVAVVAHRLLSKSRTCRFNPARWPVAITSSEADPGYPARSVPPHCVKSVTGTSAWTSTRCPVSKASWHPTRGNDWCFSDLTYPDHPVKDETGQPVIGPFRTGLVVEALTVVSQGSRINSVISSLSEIDGGSVQSAAD
ncbi:hypothetical protein RRG08_002709 [Elysia crispata]|uniref:Uncharacterized protein n=1 Tax=Elysia crispata TaxID=231223 RepID=A0AAE0XU02_9GAST|nr:hypothetical protein RRG08_002709 [Elysia crispata]